MCRRGRPQPIEALLCELGLGAPGVARTGQTLHEAVLYKAIDQPRGAALGQDQDLGEAAHPQPSIGRFGEEEEGDVLLVRQAVLGSQVLVEAARELGVRAHERPPRGEPGIAGGQLRSGSFEGLHGKHPTAGLVDMSTNRASRRAR